MSAIVGVYYLDGRSVSHTSLERMVEILAHRGPNGVGAWSEGDVGLGHRMLWTTPESLQEKLPAVNPASDLVITADARIDNRDELLTTLNFSGCPNRELTDSQLIVAAYEKWGERCPEKLLGDFAFAIWDGRKQVLFCARDHFGVKPFYYHYRQGFTFVFGSEIKAILCLPEVPSRVNDVKVGYHLAGIREDREMTFYQDIFRLPAGHRMRVSPAGMRIQPYWSLDPSTELCLNSDEEYAEAFREKFTKSVSCRLRSRFPVGLMLSGGLDSSSICCMARELLKQNGNHRLHTFSFFGDTPESNESLFIRAVVRQGSVEPHYVRVAGRSPLADLARVLWHMDEPPFANNTYLVWALSSTAHRQGLRVLLNGYGGDQSVGRGFGYLRELAYKWRWLKLAFELRPVARNFNKPLGRPLWNYIRLYSLRPWVPKTIRHLRRAWCSQVQAPDTLINPDFVRRIDLEDRIEALEQRSKPLRSERENHHQDITSGENQNVLELLDKVAGAFSLEACYPFFDPELVAFCLSLPPDQKLRGGYDRAIMRNGIADLLPPQVRIRVDKAKMGTLFDRNLVNYERDRIEDLVYNDCTTDEYVNKRFLRQAYQRYPPEDPEAPTHDAFNIWAALTLALWHRHNGLAHTLEKR
jgi:asparagine synthase (glutamine-hydrolysing)